MKLKSYPFWILIYGAITILLKDVPEKSEKRSYKGLIIRFRDRKLFTFRDDIKNIFNINIQIIANLFA